MRMWRNGEVAEVVQKIIEHNFKVIGKHLPHNILSLSTTERNLLGSDYLSEGLIVYDTTLNKWFQYNNGDWVEYPIGSAEYCQTILSEDWTDNKITIPYSTHLITNPIVVLSILDGSTYCPVIGGVSIDNDYNITLSTDMPFNGKVVIK